VATSEALPFLTRPRTACTTTTTARDHFSVTGPRTYTGGLRGGFRFAAIQLTSPPALLTLTAAGVNFAPTARLPDRYQGYFISSMTS
jgi:hypothetical protein